MACMLQRLGFPSVGEHRRFVTAIAVDAVGSGVFMPVSMLYFLVATPLSLVADRRRDLDRLGGLDPGRPGASAASSTGSARSGCSRSRT